jgi:acyl-CoA synthetase (AMP-forming)/AMP-acid ligase II
VFPTELHPPRLWNLSKPEFPPVANVTVGAMLDRWVAKYPGAEAFRATQEDVCDPCVRVETSEATGSDSVSHRVQIRWTFKDLKRHTMAMASGMLEHRMKPGERVLLWLSNDAEHVVAPLAAAAAGLVVCYAPKDATADQLGKLLDLVQPRMLIFNPTMRADVLDVVRSLVPESADPYRDMRSIPWVSARYPFLRQLWHTDPNETHFGASGVVQTLAYMPEHYRLVQAASHFRADSPFAIQPDASLSKVTVYSHAAVVAAAQKAAAAIKLTEGDSLCVAENGASVSGMVTGFLAAFSQGIPVVLPSKKYDAAVATKAVADEGCTVWHAAGAAFPAPTGLRVTQGQPVWS